VVDKRDAAAQRYAHFGLPHPDAEAIERAIEELQDTIVDWDQSGSDLMRDMLELWAEHRNARDYLFVETYPTAVMVRHAAIVGAAPRWETEAPVLIYVQAERRPHGVPVVIGECRGKNLYTAGSFCPLRWDPSPIAVAQVRARYAAWWDGLSRLASSLKLAEHTALPPAARPRPWISPPEKHAILSGGPSILPPMPPLKPRRKRAEAPRKLRLGAAIPRE
jgi:hypothetical protein